MRTLAFLLGKALRRRFRLLLVFGLLAVGLCAAYLELVVLADRNGHPLNHSELLIWGGGGGGEQRGSSPC